MPPEPSKMIALGSPMPSFELSDSDGNRVSPDSVGGAKATVVMFLCNHCPFVVHVKDELRLLYTAYSDKGVRFVAINSNDAEQYPADSPENMKLKAQEWDWQFPYLYDSTQQVAKSFGAVCTPDIFVYDSEHKLAYRGQLDDSRPNNGLPVDGNDIRLALDALIAGDQPTADQKPSIGCSIKWRE